jgi:hypothetical protein
MDMMFNVLILQYNYLKKIEKNGTPPEAIVNVLQAPAAAAIYLPPPQAAAAAAAVYFILIRYQRHTTITLRIILFVTT